MKLGTITDLLVSVRRMAHMLDLDSGRPLNVDEVRGILERMIKDQESLVKFTRAVRIANGAAKRMEEAPISFFGGQMAQDLGDVEDPVDDLPKRAREASKPKGEVRRPKAYGKKEENDD